MKIIGVAGWSGAGKTTLITRLIPVLTARGVRVSTIKHAHHRFDIDRPGKDSYVHRMSGATEVLVASGSRWALMHELRDEEAPPLPALVAKLTAVDLVIVEGFKRDRHAKIEVHRPETGKPLLFPNDPAIKLIVTDAAGPFPLPRLPAADIEAIASAALDHATSTNDL